MQKQLIVIQKDADTITLENADASCSSCSTKGVCGVGVLGKLSKKTITQQNNGEQIGDSVNIYINNSEFIKNSAVLYILPVVILFIGVVITSAYYPNNTLYQALGGVIFFIATLTIIKKLA